MSYREYLQDKKDGWDTPELEIPKTAPLALQTVKKPEPIVSPLQSIKPCNEYIKPFLPVDAPEDVDAPLDIFEPDAAPSNPPVVRRDAHCPNCGVIFQQ